MTGQHNAFFSTATDGCVYVTLLWQWWPANLSKNADGFGGLQRMRSLLYSTRVTGLMKPVVRKSACRLFSFCAAQHPIA